MNVAIAFFMRDLRVAWSYRLSFIFQNASLLFSLLTLRFVSDMFAGSDIEALARYGGDYFSFALVGIGISVLAYPVTRTFANAVRSAQVSGTFEAMLTTRTSAISIVVNSALYGVAIAVIQLLLLWAVGGGLFGADLRLAQLPVVALVLVLTLGSLGGIGLLSAAFVVAFKQNEPFSSVFVALSLLVSGIMYPTSVLPTWLEWVAPLLPLTHAAALARHYFIQGADAGDVAVHMTVLAAFSLLIPLGLFALQGSINHARRAGSLSQY